jgi:alpha-glucosidase (family GH31 glycosyl hydrolase)
LTALREGWVALHRDVVASGFAGVWNDMNELAVLDVTP